ncbi:hypothetical protein PAXINDRAFT_102260 [Paxillus involutus ATCC 200175]|uniref:Unplaced genomic scaffold PAXINscaffold_147, whole genome shotgun sequence n=1 Tax=Paxillus involutus ATCC 200175 TaxID=664439 RepID=A0A0C9TQC4_PAXIN|nr:hypothetical protein PAXINDRAFT_102260 [Paxillus involutus ATCC 200175]
MATLRRIKTDDGRFLTLVTEDGPVTAEADNPGALNQIWNIPGISGIQSTMQNLGYIHPEPYAGLGADDTTIVGGQEPIEWNFISAGGHSFIQNFGSLTWTIEPGIGSTVRDYPHGFQAPNDSILSDGQVKLAAESLTDPAQQLALIPSYSMPRLWDQCIRDICVKCEA